MGCEVPSKFDLLEKLPEEELKARIDVILRRFQRTFNQSNDHVLTFQNLTIDQLAHKAFYKDEDYPVFVNKNEDVNNKIKHYSENMQRVVEVYNLSIDLESQLESHRVWNI